MKHKGHCAHPKCDDERSSMLVVSFTNSAEYLLVSKSYSFIDNRNNKIKYVPYRKKNIQEIYMQLCDLKTTKMSISKILNFRKFVISQEAK